MGNCLDKYEDITDRIDINIREVKDVEFNCPKCKLNINKYDVDVGKYNIQECPKCEHKIKFYIKDWI